MLTFSKIRDNRGDAWKLVAVCDQPVEASFIAGQLEKLEPRELNEVIGACSMDEVLIVGSKVFVYKKALAS